MDIRIQGVDAERLGREAVGAVFGDDIATGPVRGRDGTIWRPPAQLITEAIARGAGDRLFAVQLFAPIDVVKADDTQVWAPRMHLVNVLVNGRHVGHALRMDAGNQQLVREWQASWLTRRPANHA
jgi:hypothetical protein